MQSEPRGGGGGGAASVGGGGGCARPQDMAHNKIPPRWLNCPRRGQPVAGKRDGGVVFECLSTRGSMGGLRGRSLR